MPDWSITIVSPTSGDELATFSPSPRRVIVADNVSWNNQTDGEHEPWPLDPDGVTPAATGWGINAVLKDQSTIPYSVPDAPGTTIKYCCKIHPQEIGEIEILTAPPEFD
jgi:hypothetical protein